MYGNGAGGLTRECVTTFLARGEAACAASGEALGKLQEEIQIEAPEAVFVARQPIFDRKNEVWGYELLFRNSASAPTAVFSDDNVATSKVIGDGFHLARPSVNPNFKILINFPRDLLLEGAAFTLPPELCIIELLETIMPEPEVLRVVDELRQAGYKIALDDYFGQPEFGPLLARADIVKVDILGRDPAHIIRVFNQLKPYGCQILAEKVESRVIYDLCKKLGFHLFQGFFFSRPEIIPGKKLSSSEGAKLRLLNEIGKTDFDLRKLAGIIAHDLSISYRLLRYINSVHFSRPYRVDSIKQALNLLGQRQLSQWLRVTVLSDLDAGRKTQVVAATSVQRARFLETLVVHLDPAPHQAETMFMIGLFSLLDVLLCMPMEQALADLPLEDEVKRPLLGEECPAREWLRFLEHFERANWDEVVGKLGTSGLSTATASRLYVDALTWTRNILDPVDGEA